MSVATPADLLAASDRFRHQVLLVALGRHALIVNAAKAARLIRDLKHVLGVLLFERSTHGVVPTAAGKTLIRRAGVALAEMDAAHPDIA